MRKKLFSTGLVALLLVTLGGCLGQKPPEVVTLTWWITFPQDSDEYPAFEAIAKAYTEKTGTVVKLVSVPWDDIAPKGEIISRLASEQEAGSGPDIWGPVSHTWVSSYAAQEQALSLEASQVQNPTQYIQAALQACQVDGKQFALPVSMDSVALLYNKSLVSEPPGSFEELVNVAKGLTDAKNDRWGLVLPLLSPYHVYPFMDGYGGYIFRCESNLCQVSDIGLNNEGSVRGIQYLSDLYVKKKLFPELLADRAVMEELAVRLFVEGKAAMLIDGPWVLSEVEQYGIDYGVASIPRLPGTEAPPRPLTIVQAIVGSADTSRPVETVDLMNYLASPESVLALHEALRRMPARRDVLQSSRLRNDPRIKAWREQATAGVPLPSVPALGYVWGPWGQALEEAIPGLVPVQDALDQAVKETKGYME